ncbi:hypothetical protein R3P38DRAFT_3008039 [Favolaschia claudopus]|uniref:BTB domain-containing protein n=1 Tax=Favolaschia claudopus TaxID=2862362 RepID=A0AAW0AIM4_9AGAR
MAQAAQSPSPPAFVTTPPFDDSVSADTILRSSDGIDFHVSRVILCSASPFFKDMFSLPQDTSSGAGIPVIPVAENSQLLDAFLRFWYPGATQKPFEDLDQLADVIELAMMKYDLQYLAPLLRKQLVAHKEAHCLSVFAVACRYGWNDIAKDAARQALTLDLHFLISAKSPHLERITGQQFQSLQRYHVECSKAASAAGRSLIWTDTEYAWRECTSCEPYALERIVTVGPPLIIKARAWIFRYLDDAAALLKEKPAANVKDDALIVGVHKKIVACGQSGRPSPCQNKGLQDLFKFITEKYIPAINEAIEAVPLRI